MNKRDFLKIAGAASLAGVVCTQVSASGNKNDGEICSKCKVDDVCKACLGKFKVALDNKHSPILKAKRTGDVVEFTLDVSKHPQSKEHYISDVRLLSADGKCLYKASFDEAAGISKTMGSIKLAAGTKVCAVSSCNKHGFYKSEATV